MIGTHRLKELQDRPQDFVIGRQRAVHDLPEWYWDFVHPVGRGPTMYPIDRRIEANIRADVPVGVWRVQQDHRNIAEIASSCI